MLRAAYCRYDLKFREPAITSRSTMLDKLTYFVKIWDTESPEIYGIGECALFRGLSCDDRPDYEDKLACVCRNISRYNPDETSDYPSITFGVETALYDLSNGGRRIPFPSPWAKGETPIPINGLVWMGTADKMRERVSEKIAQGFHCLKFKVGGIDFDDEFKILQSIRHHHPAEELEIRLDANGAFTPQNAMERLERLSSLNIHSIEQPIRAGQWTAMKEICRLSPIDIALDEEVIGISSTKEMAEMLSAISPAYIILKPALCGGFSGAANWIETASKLGIKWWVTSALESNIGLNAIAQWTSRLCTVIPQGLGTGALYTNNIESPIRQIGQVVTYNPEAEWLIPDLPWIYPG